MSKLSAENDNNRLEMDTELQTLRETVFDLIKDIRDPEKPNTLEDLEVVYEHGVDIQRLDDDQYLVKIEFTPTVPHCSLASIIGLCLRAKVQRCLPDKHKVDISIKEGSHSTGDEITKQINDKERIAAAMENPNLRDLVNKCLQEND